MGKNTPVSWKLIVSVGQFLIEIQISFSFPVVSLKDIGTLGGRWPPEN